MLSATTVVVLALVASCTSTLTPGDHDHLLSVLREISNADAGDSKEPDRSQQISPDVLHQIRSALSKWSKIPKEIRHAKESLKNVKTITAHAREAVNGLQGEMDKAYAALGVNEGTKGAISGRSTVALDAFFSSTEKQTHDAAEQSARKQEAEDLKQYAQQQNKQGERTISLDNGAYSHAMDKSKAIVAGKPAIVEALNGHTDDKAEKTELQTDLKARVALTKASKKPNVLPSVKRMYDKESMDGAPMDLVADDPDNSKN